MNRDIPLNQPDSMPGKPKGNIDVHNVYVN
jgi:hypothetical protein